MASKYQINNHQEPHFITFATVQWVDALTRPEYKNIIVDSLKYCIENKGLLLFGWVIMTNHVHMIAAAEVGFNLSDILRDFKKYTSKKITRAIIENTHESRREWMIWIFESAGRYNSNNTRYQFWQQDNRPIELSTSEMLHQRMEYIHMNPIKEDIVHQPEHYVYSSAIDYCGGKGLLELEDI